MTDSNLILPSQYDKFDMDEGVTFLNCAYMSPQLRAVTAAGVQGVVRKAKPWRVLSEDFFTETELVRQAFAELILADADDIAFIPAASYGIATAAANIETNAGDNILVLDEQFPSNIYSWRELAEERQLQIRTAPYPEDFDWTRTILQNIDQHTAIVALPHCHWTDGSVVDLAAVRQRCDDVGAALVIDATQSLGAMPFDLAAIRPDFLIVASYKWLLGPYSLGFMYVDKKYHQGTPLEHNWIARKNSQDFGGLVNYQAEFQTGARRFDVGERSNFALMPMAKAALEQILEWRVAAINQTLGTLTQTIRQHALTLGLQTVAEPFAANHLTAIKFADKVPQALLDRLAQEQVHVSVRSRNIRVSPHLYNNMADVDRLFNVIESVKSGR